jgi:hypothetical protein
MVSDVVSAGVPVEFVVIDYDTDGADEGDLVNVPQDANGEHYAEAYVSEAPMSATVRGAWVLASHNRFS